MARAMRSAGLSAAATSRGTTIGRRSRSSSKAWSGSVDVRFLSPALSEPHPTTPYARFIRKLNRRSSNAWFGFGMN